MFHFPPCTTQGYNADSNVLVCVCVVEVAGAHGISVWQMESMEPGTRCHWWLLQQISKISNRGSWPCSEPVDRGTMHLCDGFCCWCRSGAEAQELLLYRWPNLAERQILPLLQTLGAIRAQDKSVTYTKAFVGTLCSSFDVQSSLGSDTN